MCWVYLLLLGATASLVKKIRKYMYAHMYVYTYLNISYIYLGPWIHTDSPNFNTILRALGFFLGFPHSMFLISFLDTEKSDSHYPPYYLFAQSNQPTNVSILVDSSTCHLCNPPSRKPISSNTGHITALTAILPSYPPHCYTSQGIYIVKPEGNNK